MAVTALSGVWTPERDARGLFVPKANGVDAPVSSTAGFISARKFHYNYAVAGSNGIYTTVFNKILRRSDQNYGPVNLRSVNTPYGVGIDAQTGWQAGGYPTQPGGWSVPRQTWISLFYIYDAAKVITNYPRFFGGVGNNPSIRNQTISWNNPAGEQALVVSPETNYGGIEVSVNGIGNGLHCMVVTSNAGGSSTGVRIFLNGQFVATTTAPSGWNGGTFPNTDFYANSVSQSGLNIGNILFTAILYDYTASDSEAQKLSTDPYSYFFQDAPKTSAKRRLFSGVLSLPDPPTEFTSTKAGRIIRPSTLRQQPQGSVQIDWSHPLARGLVYAQVPGSARRGFFRLSDPQISSSNFGTGLSNGLFSYELAEGANGVGIKGRSTMTNTAGATSGTLNLIQSSSGGDPVYTYAGIFERPVLDTTQQSIATFAINGGSALTTITQNSGSNVSTFSTRFVQANSSTEIFNATVTNLIVDKKLNVVFSIYENNQLPRGIVNNTELVLDNNKAFDGISTSFGANYINATGTYIGFGAFFWARKLTATEISSFTENPWQLFKPAAGRLYFLPATTTAFKGGRFLPRRWKTQPQGTGQLNWNNPIATGLVWSSAPSVNNNLELVSNKAFEFPNSSTGEIPNSLKTSFSGRTFAHGHWLLNNTLPITSSFTMALVGELNQQLPNTISSFAQFYPGYFNTELRLFGNNANGFRILGLALNGSGTTISTNTIITTASMFGRKFIAVSTPAAINQALNLYVNGVLISATTSGLWTGTTTQTFTDQAFFGRADYSQYFSQIALFWNRRLTDAEHLSMTENPWQIFKPNPGRIYFLPGATRRGKFLFLF